MKWQIALHRQSVESVMVGMKPSVKKLLQSLEGIGRKQKWLADQAGFAESRVGKWKDGTGQPSPPTLFKIARALAGEKEDYARRLLIYFSDDEMNEIPEPELTDDEVEMIKAIRRMGHAEAWKRILDHHRAEGGMYTPGSAKNVAVNPKPKSSEDSQAQNKKRPVR